jgi:WD40 repeat protein
MRLMFIRYPLKTAVIMSLVAFATGDNAGLSAPEGRTDCYGDPLPRDALARLGTLRFRVDHTTRLLAFASDPTSVLLPSQDGGVVAYDVHSGAVRLHLHGSEKTHVLAIAVSPFRQVIAAAVQNTIHLWDPSGDAKGYYLVGHKDIVRRLAFSPDGKCLASASLDLKIYLWEVKQGKLLAQLDTPKSVDNLVFLPNGKRLAFVTTSSAGLLDIATSKSLWQLDMELSEILAYSPRDNSLIVGSPDGQLVFLASTTGKEMRRIPGHAQRLSSIDISPDGEKVASADVGGTILVRNVETGKELIKIEAAQGQAASIKISPDGSILGGAGFGYAPRLWKIPSGAEFGNRPAHYSTVCGIFFPFSSADKVATVSENETRLWEARTGRCLAALKTGNEWITALAGSPDGRYLAAGTEANQVWVWTLLDGQLVCRFQGAKGHVRTIAFSPNSGHLACGGEDGKVRVWHISSGKDICRRSVDQSADIQQIVFSSDGTRVEVLAGNLLTSFGIEKSKEPRILPGFRQSSWIARTSDEQSYISLEDDRICLRSSFIGTERRHFPTDGMRFACAAQSPDGGLLATGGWDHIVRIWDQETGKEIRSFRGHHGDIRSLAFDPTGSLLVSGSEDTTALVWNVGSQLFAGDPAPEGKPVDLERSWTSLAGEDISRVYISMGTLAMAGKAGSKFLREKLISRVIPAGRIDDLVRELANDRFETREHAFHQLCAINTLADGPIRELLASSRDPEVKRRLQELADRIHSMELSKEDLRWFRALRILEHSNDAPARQLVGELAKGDPKDRRTLAACGALPRMIRRSHLKP